MSEKLAFLLQHDASTDTVHLEYSDIHDLSALMGDLRSFPNLRELYVHGNRLTTLTPDMSGLRKSASASKYAALLCHQPLQVSMLRCCAISLCK
jgi:hypothetical protein